MEESSHILSGMPDVSQVKQLESLAERSNVSRESFATLLNAIRWQPKLAPVAVTSLKVAQIPTDMYGGRVEITGSMAHMSAWEHPEVALRFITLLNENLVPQKQDLKFTKELAKIAGLRCGNGKSVYDISLRHDSVKEYVAQHPDLAKTAKRLKLTGML